MSNESDRASATRIIAGVAAGAIGGLAGAAVKQACEAVAPPRTPDREPPPGVLAQKLVRVFGGGDLSEQRKERISLAVHWAFSTLTSAAYGALVARVKPPRAANGVGFGIAVWAGFHEIALPLLGATPPLRELPLAEQANEFVSHVLFGVTVESVRARVLAALPPEPRDDRAAAPA